MPFKCLIVKLVDQRFGSITIESIIFKMSLKIYMTLISSRI